MWPKSACLNETKTNIKVEAMGAVDATLLSGGGWWLEDCRILDNKVWSAGGYWWTLHHGSDGRVAILAWPALCPLALLLQLYQTIPTTNRPLPSPRWSLSCSCFLSFFHSFRLLKTFVCITNDLRRCTFKDSFRWLAVHLMKSVFNTKSS